MGWIVIQIASEFFIHSSDRAAALSAIKQLAGKEPDQGPDRPHFAFVETARFLQATNLIDALAAWRWIAEVDAEGNIISLDFAGEKEGHDYVLFQSIAPYVRDDSHIDMVREDGRVRRWLFHKGTLERQIGEILFRSEPRG